VRWFRSKLDQIAVRRFYNSNPKWFCGRHGERDIATALATHPIWERVSIDLRVELSNRLASAKDHFTSFDADHAFELVAPMTDMCDVLHQNILPVDRDASHCLADKCWIISETFRKRAIVNFCGRVMIRRLVVFRRR
jgi:hypothetical protein